MSATMTERFNVAGALLVKLFGRSDDESRSFAERADGVRVTGVRAGPGRPGVLRGPVAGGRHRHGRHLLGGRPAGDGGRPVGGHARGAGRLRHPAVRAAHGADQRPGRPDERAGVLRAGVRGARLARRRSTTGPAPSTWCAARGAIDIDDVWFTYPRDADRRHARARPHRGGAVVEGARDAVPSRRAAVEDGEVAVDAIATGRCCGACRPTSSRASWWRWSGRRARARRRWACSSPGSTT